MDAGYIKALEIRAKWLRWGKEQGVDVWGDLDRAAKHKYYPWKKSVHSFNYTLEHGETFYMNKQFGSLVESARQTVPDDLTYDPAWLQTREGWLWLETPFLVPTDFVSTDGSSKKTEVKGIPIRISAIGWRHVAEGTVTAKGGDSNQAGRVAGPNATQFLCFQNLNDYSPHAEGFGCWSYFMLQEGDKVIDRIRQFEDKDSMPNEDGFYLKSRETDMLHEIRWVYSAFFLMAQRLAVHIKKDTDRSTRRRAERDKLPVHPFIKVVSLRRMEEEREKNKDTACSVDWQWQWSVDGHWRNQYYPSTDSYKQIFIESYTKGPADKPFKPAGAKIFVARR